jgi:U1 small nuclear ribonucleoprotein 70kDa
MTAFLPPNLLALFAPRPPIEFLPPIESKRPPQPLSGIAEFVDRFEPPGTSAIEPSNPPESKEARKLRIAAEKKAIQDAHIESELTKWDPNAKFERRSEDPYKTLFVARLVSNLSRSRSLLFR